MEENKQTRTEEVNIFEIFEGVRKGIQDDMTKGAGRLEMLNEFATFFKEQNLKVTREVAVPAEPEGEVETENAQ